MNTGEHMCDLRNRGCEDGHGHDSAIYAVNFTGQANEVTFFGFCEVNGAIDRFCVHLTDTGSDITDVTILGSEHDDEAVAFSYTLVSATQSTTILNLRPTNPGGLTARAYGAGGDDAVIGSNVDLFDYQEFLYGNDGLDSIRGLAGDDFLYGGKHNDVLSGGPGDDTMFGELGWDHLHGEQGNDKLHGGPGNDTLFGGLNNDVLYGSTHVDRLFGDENDDVLCETTLPAPSCPASSHMVGGDGHDRASIALHPWCPASTVSLTGLLDVEAPQDTSIDWSPIHNNAVPVGPVPPWYPECIDLVELGGW